MTNPDCPACHGTGVLRTHDHIGIVDESNCDLCPQPDPTPHQPYTCAEREWLIARVEELEAGGWISCADRMPDKFTSVLGWFANGGYPIWAMHYDQEWCAELGMHELIFSDRDITHWKPIAAPKV